MFAGLLILTSVVAAQPIDPATWVTTMDYPKEEFRQAQGGIVSFRVTVAEDGKPMRCEVTEATGYKALDTRTCALVMIRARFEPARDTTGKASFAIYRNRVHWWAPTMGERQRGPIPFDAQLTVKRLPTDLPSQTTIELAFEVDALGKPSNCTPVNSWAAALAGGKAEKLDHQAVELLGKPACGSLPTDLKLKPAMDREGKPVASVQTIRVMFLEEEGKD